MLTLPHSAFGQPGQPGLSLLITHPHNVQSLSFSYYKIRIINDFNKFIYSTLALKAKIFSTRGTLTIFTQGTKKQRRKPLPKVVYFYIRSRPPSGALRSYPHRRQGVGKKLALVVCSLWAWSVERVMSLKMLRTWPRAPGPESTNHQWRGTSEASGAWPRRRSVASARKGWRALTVQRTGDPRLPAASKDRQYVGTDGLRGPGRHGP